MSCSRKLKISQEGTSDIISNMPSNITECILSHLPIRDAVRTSILSRNWRHQWVTLPHLVFDDKGIEGAFFRCQPPFVKDELVKVINGVLLQHYGSILKFTLSIRSMRSCSDIDRWINFLSRNGIEEFVLEIWNNEHHKLPCYFFSCLHLRHLKLRRCIIKPPPTFNGFQRLTSVEFRMVTIEPRVFENFITNCPLLEKLMLFELDGLDCLNIHAPNLRGLYFIGNFKSMCFKYTPLLTTMAVALCQLPAITEHPEHNNSSNLIEFFGSLSIIVQLRVGLNFLKFLAVGSPPKRLPTTFNCLLYLDIYNLSFEDLDSVSSALCLIRNSPKLGFLEIRACSSSYADMKPVLEFMEAQKCSYCCLRQLKFVNMKSLSGVRPEMELIEFLLANSPVLKTMRIVPCKVNPFYKESRMLKDLMRFCRASPKAEILYLDGQE